MNPLFDPERIKALLAGIDPVSGGPAADNGAVGGLLGSMMARQQPPAVSPLDQEGNPAQFPMSYQMRQQAYLDMIRRAQSQPARPGRPSALDVLLQSYRPSDNLDDRRRPFAPLWRGGAYPAGSPSAKLFNDQGAGLSRRAGGHAENIRGWARDWFEANILGQAEPRVDVGLSREPLDVELRQDIAAALAGRRP